MKNDEIKNILKLKITFFIFKPIKHINFSFKNRLISLIHRIEL